MFERTVTPEDLARLERQRQDAERAYNEGLTRLDQALPRPFEAPAPPDAPADRALTGLDAPAARPWQPPAPEAPRRLRWLHRLLAPAVGPAFERQERVNRALIAHLEERAAAASGERQRAGEATARLAAHLAETLTFQSSLLQYLQRITPFVDTKDREVAGLMRRINEDSGAAIAGLIAGLEELAAGQRGLHEAVQVLQGDQRGLHEAVQVLQGKQHGVRESLQILQGAQRVAAREVRRLRGGLADPDAVAAPSTPTDEPVGPPPPAAFASPPPADAVAYAVFEDAFRGSTAEIAKRQHRYLACFQGASDVLDVGCGRGEFLELLRTGGIDARGIDANTEMVERCRERGLDVTRADALAHIAALPGESLGGLFAAQVVEHLEADYLLQLLASLQRALRPGARIVLETINPACWSAFFGSYLRDITHRRPLHPDTLSYLLRAHGFVDVEVVYSAPVPDAGRLQRVPPEAASGDAAARALIETFNGNVDHLNDRLFADQDYAAVATRA